MATILYVDDDITLLDVGKSYLEKGGEFTVVTSPSATDALDRLQKDRFDAIVADYQMPRMDGIGLLKKVRASGSMVPFVLFTGKGREDVVIQAINEGADNYLQKEGEPRALFAELTHKLRQAIAQRQAVVALEESEERYRAVVEDQTEFICRFTPDGRLTFVNNAYCRYFGLEKTACLNKPQVVDMPPEDAAQMKRHLASLTPQNPVAPIEHRIRMPDGTLRWQRWYDRALFSREGALTGFQSVGRDITDQRQMEENLRSLQQLSRRILESDSLPESFRLCLETAMRLSQMDSGMIYLVSRATRDLELVTSAGLAPERVEEIAHIPAHSPSARIVYARTPRYASTFDTATGAGRVFHDEGLRTIASLPVHYHDTVIACLCLSSHTDDTVPQAVRAILELITSHIGNVMGRILSEDAVRQSEEQYRVLIEHIQDGAFLAQDDKLVFWNSRLARMAGYAVETSLGIALSTLVAPEDRDMVIRRHRGRIAGESHPESYEFRILHEDGTTRIPVRMSVGTGLYRNRPAVIGTIHDVRKDREQERALRESERRLLLAQRVAKMGDVTWDFGTGEVQWSDGIYDLLQYDRSETFDADRINREVRHPDDAARVMRWMEDSVASGRDTLTPNEFRILRKDGVVLHVHAAGVIQREPKKAARIFMTIQDITERRESEKLLEILSRSLTEALIMAKMAAWDYDVASETFLFNDAFYAMHGMTAQDARGYQMAARTFIERYTAPSYASRLLDTIVEALESTDPEFGPSIEGELIKKDGSLFWVTTWIRTERDDAGTVIGFHGVNQDITERRRNEEALHNVNRQLNLLISVTRHDIRNQLVALKALLSLSRETLSDPAATLEFIESEEGVAGAIERQISFTKEYQSLGVKPPVWQNLARCVKDAAHGLDFAGRALETTGMESTEVYADSLLFKVFYNLFDNALRHGGEGMTAIRIEVRETDDGCVILFSDNGCGIPADEKEAIFDRGYGRNSGYGLFFVREILGITEIAIHEVGNEGEGARFEIRVPRQACRSGP
ncbi:MAG: PAS domain S-box protein [Methanomicrobiales archaeon]|nr:PAS domain S-box protein [Methanomicrobiales archaeon]